MTSLARESDGNHVFVEKSTQLVDVFNREFNDVLSVVAQEVVIKIHCRDDVRPVRSLNGDAEITGQDVYVKLNQLYSEQEKYIILELELPARPSGSSMEVADVSVSYTNMETKTDDRLSSVVGVNFSSNSGQRRRIRSTRRSWSNACCRLPTWKIKRRRCCEIGGHPAGKASTGVERSVLEELRGKTQLARPAAAEPGQSQLRRTGSKTVIAGSAAAR